MEATELDLQQRRGQVLVLSRSAQDIKKISGILADRIPETFIYATGVVDDYNAYLRSKDIDVVIVDHRMIEENAFEMIQSCKVADSTPAIVVFAGLPQPTYVSSAYDAGCHKYFIEGEEYSAEMAHVIQHILRLRKLEEENNRLIARLTEANILLEEKNRRLDEFSATVAHDIRGPLGGVVMKLDYVLDKYKGEINEQFASVLDRALASSQRLTEIVQAMYEFAKLGTKAAKMGPVDLKRLVEEVVRDMNFDESLDISIGIGDLPNVWGNDQLLRRVFINLIGNAVKYNDKEETIINLQTAGYVERSLSRFVSIAVEDNGPGIDACELKDIFRFFSRGTAGKRDNDGLGVGLTVVQRIVELHFGSISVESELGKGTTFTLTLPTEKIDFIK